MKIQVTEYLERSSVHWCTTTLLVMNMLRWRTIGFAKPVSLKYRSRWMEMGFLDNTLLWLYRKIQTDLTEANTTIMFQEPTEAILVREGNTISH